MALSKELKQYIEKKFDERIKVLNTARTNEIEEGRKELISVMESKVKEFREFFKSFNESLPDGLTIASNIIDYTGINNRNYNPLYWNCPKDKANEINNRYDALIRQAKNEKEFVIIKLSMEKDFDRINEMLKEYGIELS